MVSFQALTFATIEGEGEGWTRSGRFASCACEFSLTLLTLCYYSQLGLMMYDTIFNCLSSCTSDCHRECSITDSHCQTEAAFTSADAVVHVPENDSTIGPMLGNLYTTQFTDDDADPLTSVRRFIRGDGPRGAVFLFSVVLHQYLHTFCLPWIVSGN